MSAGKGDKSRVRDTKRYRENFDAIRWKKDEVTDIYKNLAETVIRCWIKSPPK